MSLVSVVAAFAVLFAPPVSGSPPKAPFTPVQTTPPAADVILSRLTVPDGEDPAIEVGVWQPAGPHTGPRPLIIISHGNGGDFRSHRDTAEALAKAGFVVVALTHTGDNWRDQSRATDVVNRTRHLSVLIDYMLSQWEGRAGIDPDRIGAFGFSAGGLTVLAAAGGNPDLTRLIDHCRANPGFYDCRLVAAHSVAFEGGEAPVWPHDTRIKALVVAAPALGFTLTREGLADVTQPVQLWQAGSDQILPSPYYAEPVRDALPNAPEYHRVEGAGHFDFMPPCSPQLAAAAPMICAPTPGFDRAAFHQVFNEDVTRFFQTRL